MYKRVAILLGGMLCALPLFAADPPPDAAVDMNTPNKTLVPKVVPNSGRLEWVPHDRDLTRWTTLSHADKRDASRPRTAVPSLPLNGDSARGREIAMSPARGNCVTCHRLPGDDWPGTVGNSLLQYKKYEYTAERIYQQIYDPRVFNPTSVMPPYGSHNLLKEQEIRDLVAYLQSIE
jgi:sulfur oxidation c-type cytochrome SoxX